MIFQKPTDDYILLYLYLVPRDGSGNIAHGIEKNRGTVAQRIRYLRHDDYLRQASVKEGTYELTPKGEQYVEELPETLHEVDVGKLKRMYDKIRENETTIYDIAGRVDRLEFG